jgi:hypothetical protein
MSSRWNAMSRAKAPSNPAVLPTSDGRPSDFGFNAYRNAFALTSILSFCTFFVLQVLRLQCHVPTLKTVQMLLARTKAAGRAVLRRPPFSYTQTNLVRRHTSTNTATKDKPVDVTSKSTLPSQSPAPPLALWQRFSLVSRGIAAYGRSQQNHPYRTQFVSSLIIFTLGDLSAQCIGGQEYDPKRTGRALAISACSSILSYKWLASPIAYQRSDSVLNVSQVHVSQRPLQLSLQSPLLGY